MTQIIQNLPFVDTSHKKMTPKIQSNVVCIGGTKTLEFQTQNPATCPKSLNWTPKSIHWTPKNLHRTPKSLHWSLKRAKKPSLDQFAMKMKEFKVTFEIELKTSPVLKLHIFLKRNKKLWHIFSTYTRLKTEWLAWTCM